MCQAGSRTPHLFVAAMTTRTNNAAADVATGVVLLLVGGLLVAGGVAWGLDYRRMMSSDYESVVQWWDKIPGFGAVYKKIVPFGQYRYFGMIGFIVMGLLLCIAGIGCLIVA